MKNSVFSNCGMCSVRCPIRVEVEDGRVKWIEGNPYVPGMEGSLCARGSAGIALLYDSERLQYPMIRTGERGSGQFKRVSWEEAFKYVADKVKDIQAKYGKRTVALLDRGAGLFGEMQRLIVRGMGSPNYFSHDDFCRKNVDLAYQTLLGYGRPEVGYDFANTKHMVFYGRNAIEALGVREVNNIVKALENGADLTYLDVRVSKTATKATRFYQIRPGTDYAFNLALIHVILKENLYDKDFVDKFFDGTVELENFVKNCTPEWAEKETGIPAYEIVNLAKALSAAKPRVILYPGWFSARYMDAFYFARSVIILNALLGSIEQKGGLILAKTPKEVGAKGLNSLLEKIPAPEEKRVEAEAGKGFLYDGAGHILHLYRAIKKGEPYPVKALFVVRYDPFAGITLKDIKEVLDGLDLLVAIDTNYSATAWYADVILPESTYLERDDMIGLQRGAKPAFIMRRQAIKPIYDTKGKWEITKGLLHAYGVGQYMPFETIEELWNYQLEGTGVKIEDFDKSGQVALCKDAKMYSRDELKFKTPSGKVEILSSKMAEREVPFFYEHQTPAKPNIEEGEFRLVFGRMAVHTHVQTHNNRYLNEIVPENELWINDKAAAKLGIKNGDWVEVSSGDFSGKIRAKVTPFIHPEAVFMYRGFENEVPWKTRSFGKGLNEGRLLSGAFDKMAHGSHTGALFENFVRVKKA
ncbi:molybdopterin-dependent oxidoreductase [Thermodesulfovibrio sp. Kuro-1]|uniref:molybdopterin-containing oxidoreductase family protein n=1 Tax=Thermodesulfovibrio sp. Kuro-1 TaxID=2580394 RepID=UPI001144F67E|nr:molybdopterin-dependent oxidoreductase [Thermodesulfovibrio sp. Kuro-1]MBC7189535.1 molybdopterin-dependent oxidoreductase [Candidatus Aerophobetes bacterium]